MPSATKIISFIEEKRETQQRQDFIDNLGAFTGSVLSESNDSQLHDLLVRSGFDLNGLMYKPSLDIDKLLGSLRKLTDRRNQRLSLVRSSQAGLRNTIKSFAPDMLMAFTLEKKFHLVEASLTPFSVFFNGVCMLADISGFTRLSGNFCSGGRDGIDQLQQATNTYLGDLVKTVYAFGGDVLKFAGDALVCVFSDKRNSDNGIKLTMADICSNAVQCATELAQICTPELTIHVAVSCGPMCFAVLGGHNGVWESLVSGACIAELSQCLDDASSKQTVVSQIFIDTLGPIYSKEIDIELLPSGNHRVISASKVNSAVIQKVIKRRAQMLLQGHESRFALFPNDPEFLATIRHFVPMPVAEGLKSGSFDYLAELREVTTMFMSWDSYDDVIHEDLLLLQIYFIAAEKVLAESGGFIRQFLIDDKGCVLIACWGVPTASYPDNTRRAVCAGAILKHDLDLLGMKSSVGITTGNVFCGSVGSYVRREYAVIGDVVNLAARLMSKAKGGLFLDEATYSRIPTHLHRHLEKLPPIAVKGKTEPITPYSLKSGTGRLSFEDESDGHLEVLTIRPLCKEPILAGLRVIQKKEVTPVRFVIIEGKISPGKFEVLDWLRQICPPLNIDVLSLTMTCRDKTTDFDMVKRLFRSLVGESNFDDPQKQQFLVKQLLKQVYHGDRETIRKVAYPAVQISLGIKLNESKGTPVPTRLPPRLLNQCLRDVFTYLLRKTPKVVVIESTHFVDMCSWEVLVNFGSVKSLAMFIITMEPLQDLELAKIKLAPDTLREEIFTSENVNAKSSSSVLLNRLKLNHKKLCNFQRTTVVLMNDYSIVEVDELLRTVLGLHTCPPNVANMVHTLSGGNPFWCKEMALFIHTTGADEFMRAMNPENLNNLNGMKESLDPRDSPRSTSKKRWGPGSGIGVGVGSGSPGKTAFCSLQSKETSHMRTKNNGTSGVGDGVSVMETKRRISDDGKALELVNESEHGFAKKNTTSKLELFIVCRLEKLCREDQNILRTASIIGDVFNTAVLYSVLPPKLRSHMAMSINSLVEDQWITEVTTDPGKYIFAHPLFYQTLYDVTPAGERARLHYSIASCLEESHEGDPLFYAQLGLQYGLAKDYRSKATEYFIRAAVYNMSNGPLYYDEGLEQIIQAKIFADTAEDCGTMLGIILCHRNKLMDTRRKLLLDEDKKYKLAEENAKFQSENTNFNRNLNGNENESDDGSIGLSENYRKPSSPTRLSSTSPPNMMKQNVNWKGRVLTYVCCDVCTKDRKVSPHNSVPSSPVMLVGDDGDEGDHLEAYKSDGCGLTITGTDVFLKLFRQVEEELTRCYAELMLSDKKGMVTEWQKIIREQMKAETSQSEECSAMYENRNKRRRNVLLLKAGSIKILTDVALRKKGSILEFLGKTIPSIPKNISTRIPRNLSFRISGRNSRKIMSVRNVGSTDPSSGPVCGDENIDTSSATALRRETLVPNTITIDGSSNKLNQVDENNSKCCVS